MSGPILKDDAWLASLLRRAMREELSHVQAELAEMRAMLKQSLSPGAPPPLSGLDSPHSLLRSKACWGMVFGIWGGVGGVVLAMLTCRLTPICHHRGPAVALSLGVGIVPIRPEVVRRRSGFKPQPGPHWDGGHEPRDLSVHGPHSCAARARR